MKTLSYDRKFKDFLIFWLPVFVWMAIIFAFSAHPTGTASEIDWQDFFVKKTAHIVEYGTLAGLLYRALKNSGVQKSRSAVVAVVWAVLYAATDEFHQGFTPGRDPTVRDVIIDTIGASLSIFVLWKLLPKMPRPLKAWAEKLRLN